MDHERPTIEPPFDAQAGIEAYFDACNRGSAADIAAHFTPDAVIYDSNLDPCRGNAAIGAMWVKVRQRWGGAHWQVDTCITDPASADPVAAIEWTMHGVDHRSGDRPFAFRGSEHYRFHHGLIAEIRQYWTFDPQRLDTGLVGFDYPESTPR